ncbi:hypothetical protein QBZ16_002569 [Prototheca wickerhamii]|uniref:Uncharacterized protein n=1 Tax=Prototheca wickerhamii TaxID=3111 RepID=A0AAD9IKI7_PROWI|nr:hypothetical protein QBZ16_002569 [Prototheca wickerhamii]
MKWPRQVLSRTRRPALALPHLGIQDLRAVDWAALKQAGFKAAIFDKDNTLTVPYAMDLEPGPATALQTCQQVFGRRQVALFSNSAGLAQFDPEGKEAELLEAALGDVAFGNRHGMLTIRPEPFTVANEPLAVRAARKLEQVCVQRWREQGYTPPAHGLAGPLEAQAGRFLRTWI